MITVGSKVRVRKEYKAKFPEYFGKVMTVTNYEYSPFMNGLYKAKDMWFYADEIIEVKKRKVCTK